MLALSDALAALAADRRAAPWTLRLHAGWSGSALVRDYTLLAPPTPAAAALVLTRLHNAILLLNPASAEIHAPVEAARLEPTLGALRSIHKVPFGVGAVPLVPPPGPIDVPSSELPPERTPGVGLAAGLDIGGTGMKAVVLRDGVPVRVSSAPTWPDGEVGVTSLVRRARALLEDVAGGEPLGSLGVGLAAPMSVGGRVIELSTVLRQKVGDPGAFVGFAERLAVGLVDGPVAMFNDLANLGRYLSHQGERRVVRVQIGTSFGGCWIDVNGDVSAVEMGRLVVDVADDALPHPYLPLRGAMRSYLSNAGLAAFLAPRVGHEVDVRTSGHALRGLLDAGDPAGEAAVAWIAEVLVGVVGELAALLPGVTRVEVGGSMLIGPAGRRLERAVAGRGAIPITLSPKPGHDGAIAAAVAPRVGAVLRGHKRVGS